MKALDVMVRDVVTIAPDDTVAEAVRRLAEHDVSVVDINENVVGDTHAKARRTRTLASAILVN
jgi:CBS domain-containing protein